MEILLVNFCIYFPLSFLVMNLRQIAHVKEVLHHFDHLLITKPSSRFDDLRTDLGMFLRV